MNDDIKSASATALPIIQSTQAAIQTYLDQGAAVLPLRRGEKKPHITGWRDRNFTAEDFADADNIGLKLGSPSNGLVDFDADCPEVAFIAPRLLPPTGAVYGRPSKPFSHAFYIVDEPPAKTLAFKDASGKTLAELRSDGGQSLVPPSMHPSGEILAWREGFKPTTVSFRTLVRMARLTAAAALLARHWPEDGRHELSLILGGVLARAGYDAETVESVLKAICACRADPDPEDRVRTAKNAAEAFMEGKHVYGLPKLAERLGDGVAKALRIILAMPKEALAEPDRPQRDRAIDALHGMEFFLSSAGEPYASVEHRGHVETYAIKGSTFRRLVLARCLMRDASPVSKTAVEEAIFFAEAQAFAGGRVEELRIRIAVHEGAIYIDLGCPQWRAICITATGWDIVDRPPVKFIRANGLRALPVPEPGGLLDELRPFINVEEESDFRLFAASMLAALIPDCPYPILIVSGEQGTSKTTLCRIFRYMIDPHEADSRSPPRNEQDLYVGAAQSHVLVFDNISQIAHWFSDALCRLATGGVYAARELYTNKEESLIKAMRPVVLNGIPFTVERPDLLDRAIVLVLPLIPPENRRDETDFWADLERIRPRVLGLLCTALATGLRRLTAVRLTHKPRMADLAKWMTAAEEAFGWEPETFLNDFEDRRRRSMRDLADDVLVSTLVDLVRVHGSLSSTASELLNALNGKVAPADRPYGWPKAPNRLAGLIRALAPALRELGVEVEQGIRRPSDNNRLITLRLKEGQRGTRRDDIF